MRYRIEKEVGFFVGSESGREKRSRLVLMMSVEVTRFFREALS